MSNLRSDDKLRNIQPTDVVLGADENGCLFNIPPDNFSGSIPISIDTETGAGEELFTEPELNSFLFKKIKSEDESVGFTTDTDGNINASVNFPEIKSDTLNVEKLPDGTITINSIEKSFGYIKSYYVNSGYAPTEDSPSDGSIIRPFTNFDSAITSVIGSGTILNPQNEDARIILQTSSSTAINPTVNTLTIEFQNATLTYTGTDLYMFDTEILYPLIPKDVQGEITQSISLSILGNGEITRNNGVGIIRSIGAKRGSSTTIDNLNVIRIKIGEKTSDNINIIENINYPESVWEGDQMRDDGITKIGDSYNPPRSMKWTTLINPTAPLVVANGVNFISNSYPMSVFGSMTIYSFTNTGLWVKDTYLSMDKLIINRVSENISVSSGVVGIPNFPDVYEPKDFPAIHSDNSTLVIESIHSDSTGTFSHYGFKSFLKIVGYLYFFGKFNYRDNYYIETFIDASESTMNSITINNGAGSANINGKINYLIDSPVGTSPFGITVTNSVITGVRQINKNTSDETIPNTMGTLASINGKPYISGVNPYADDSAATADGLLKNAIYINPTNAFTTV